MNIMKALVVTSKIVAVASKNAKKIGKEMYLKSLNSFILAQDLEKILKVFISKSLEITLKMLIIFKV